MYVCVGHYPMWWNLPSIKHDVSMWHQCRFFYEPINLSNFKSLDFLDNLVRSMFWNGSSFFNDNERPLFVLIAKLAFIEEVSPKCIEAIWTKMKKKILKLRIHLFGMHDFNKQHFSHKILFFSCHRTLIILS